MKENPQVFRTFDITPCFGYFLETKVKKAKLIKREE